MRTYYTVFSWRKTFDRLFMSQLQVQPWGILLIYVANNMTYENKGDIQSPLPVSSPVSTGSMALVRHGINMCLRWSDHTWTSERTHLEPESCSRDTR